MCAAHEYTIMFFQVCLRMHWLSDWHNLTLVQCICNNIQFHVIYELL